MPRHSASADPVTSCRACPVRCDKVVYPSGCIQMECARLYAYEEGGRRFVGCVDRIFAVELDVEAFQHLQRTREGFGALRAVREPHDFCPGDVDPAFLHRGAAECANPDFLRDATRHPLRPRPATDISDQGH